MIHIAQLGFAYQGKAVLAVESFHLAAGQHALLLGPSGSGKSTLLHLLGAMLTPQTGRLQVAGTDLATLTPRQADAWRSRSVGFLPQQLALVPSLNVRENVLLAAYAGGTAPQRQRADGLLAALGLAPLAAARPHQLSQGQRQRTALARALYGRPRLILADEPTANLDDDNTEAAIALLVAQAGEAGAALVIASHDARVLAALPQAQVLRLRAGKVLP